MNKKTLILHVTIGPSEKPIGGEPVILRLVNRANGNTLIEFQTWMPLDVTQEVVTDGRVVTSHLGDLEIDGKILSADFEIEMPPETETVKRGKGDSLVVKKGRRHK